MTADDYRFEHLTDREILIQMSRDVSYINKRLQEGAETLQNHENAIKGLCTQTECNRRHTVLSTAYKWIVTLLATTFTAIIVAVWEFKK